MRVAVVIQVCLFAILIIKNVQGKDAGHAWKFSNHKIRVHSSRINPESPQRSYRIFLGKIFRKTGSGKYSIFLKGRAFVYGNIIKACLPFVCYKNIKLEYKIIKWYFKTSCFTWVIFYEGTRGNQVVLQRMSFYWYLVFFTSQRLRVRSFNPVRSFNQFLLCGDSISA